MHPFSASRFLTAPPPPLSPRCRLDFARVCAEESRPLALLVVLDQQRRRIQDAQLNDWLGLTPHLVALVLRAVRPPHGRDFDLVPLWFFALEIIRDERWSEFSEACKDLLIKLRLHLHVFAAQVGFFGWGVLGANVCHGQPGSGGRVVGGGVAGNLLQTSTQLISPFFTWCPNVLATLGQKSSMAQLGLAARLCLVYLDVLLVRKRAPFAGSKPPKKDAFKRGTSLETGCAPWDAADLEQSFDDLMAFRGMVRVGGLAAGLGGGDNETLRGVGQACCESTGCGIRFYLAIQSSPLPPLAHARTRR